MIGSAGKNLDWRGHPLLQALPSFPRQRESTIRKPLCASRRKRTIGSRIITQHAEAVGRKSNLWQTRGGVSRNAGHPDRTLRGSIGASADGGPEAGAGGRRGPGGGPRRRRKPQRCAERARRVSFHHSATHTGARLRGGRGRGAAGARGNRGLGHGRRGSRVHPRWVPCQVPRRLQERRSAEIRHALLWKKRPRPVSPTSPPGPR